MEPTPPATVPSVLFFNQEEAEEIPQKFVPPSVITLPGEIAVFGALDGSGKHSQITGFVTEVEFRPALGWEDDLFRDTSGGLKARFRRISKILSMCTVRMGDKARTDPGADHDVQDEMFLQEWENALTPLRMVGLIGLRMLTLGETYKFTGVCPLCRKPNPNLSYDLRECEVVPFKISRNEEGTWTQKLQAGRHEVLWSPLPCFREYEIFDVLTKYPNDKDTAFFLPFLVSVDGKKGPFTPANFKSFTLDEREAIRSSLDFGGVDILVTNVCQNEMCRAEYRSPLNVLDKSFFTR